MEFSDQALVIRVGKFREADLWVRFLSAKRGLFTAFAFGGSRSRRRFCGCLDILNHVAVRVSRPKNGQAFLNLQEGALLSGPQRLRTDLDRLGIAVRTGRHCTQPLMIRMWIEGTVRASFGLYNTKEEIDMLAAGIERVSRMF